MHEVFKVWCHIILLRNPKGKVWGGVNPTITMWATLKHPKATLHTSKHSNQDWKYIKTTNVGNYPRNSPTKFFLAPWNSFLRIYRITPNPLCTEFFKFNATLDCSTIPRKGGRGGIDPPTSYEPPLSTLTPHSTLQSIQTIIYNK